MKLFNPFHRRFSTKEHRLAYDLGGAEDAPVNMNMREYDLRNVPQGTPGPNGETMADRIREKRGTDEENTQPKTLGDIVDMIDVGIKNVVGNIEADFTVNYDEVLDEVARHIMKMPDMQRGVVRMTDVMQRGWNYFWDLVQVNKALPMKHPLLNSRRWKNGMKLPGIYYKGKLAKLSSRMLGPYNQRKLSGEYKRFGKAKKPAEAFDKQVDFKIRGQVKNAAVDAFDIPVDKIRDGTDPFANLQWEELQKGNDTGGQPYILRLRKPGGKMDDSFTYEPGQEPFEGLVFAYGNEENPDQSETLFVDFKQSNEVLWMAKHEDPIFKALLTEPGYFSEGQAQLYENLLAEFPDTKEGLSDIGMDFYLTHPEIGRIHKEAANLMYITETIRNAGIGGEDLSWLKNLEAVEPARVGKIQALVEAVQTGVDTGNRQVWERTLLGFMPNYAEEKGDDWFNIFLNQDFES